MTTNEIRQIVRERALPFTTESCSLVETHISWVILADHHAYKIKKPVKWSFLDFSTPEKRHFFLQRELVLNKRLAPYMYLDVLPVVEKPSGAMAIEVSASNAVDHALLMKRMDERRQMDVLLLKDRVNKIDIERIVEVLYPFHRHAQRLSEGDDAQTLFSEYADLEGILKQLDRPLAQQALSWVSSTLSSVKEQLFDLSDRLDERHRKGFNIDGHGDLHCRNILLESPPVIFDCIEFNDNLRQLDILSELAFLCMDLDRYGREDLAEYFMSRYQERYRCLLNEADAKIFLFYKLHRAGVQLKVHAIRAMTAESADQMTQLEENMQRFLKLMIKYYSLLIE